MSKKIKRQIIDELTDDLDICCDLYAEARKQNKELMDNADMAFENLVLRLQNVEKSREEE